MTASLAAFFLATVGFVSSAWAAPMVLPVAGKVSNLSVCSRGFIPRCLHLKRENGEAREILEGYAQRDQKITRAEFERKVTSIYNKIKPVKNPNGKCPVNLVIETKIGEEVSHEMICSENYTMEEWAEWSKLFR